MKSLVLSILLTTCLSLAACQSAKEKSIQQIKNAEKELFSQKNKEVNVELASNLIKAYILFADQQPTDSLSAGYVYKAAEISDGIGDGESAIKYYQRVIDTYPNYHKAAQCLMLQGFVAETTLHNKDLALKYYSDFIIKYPNHLLTKSVQASVVNLSTTVNDIDLIRKFEQQNNSNPKQ